MVHESGGGPCTVGDVEFKVAVHVAVSPWKCRSYVSIWWWLLNTYALVPGISFSFSFFSKKIASTSSRDAAPVYTLVRITPRRNVSAAAEGEGADWPSPMRVRT